MENLDVKEVIDEKLEEKQVLNSLEALNILIQVCNKYEGTRADFILIEKAIDVLINLDDIKNLINKGNE